MESVLTPLVDFGHTEAQTGDNNPHGDLRIEGLGVVNFCVAHDEGREWYPSSEDRANHRSSAVFVGECKLSTLDDGKGRRIDGLYHLSHTRSFGGIRGNNVEA